MVGLTTYYTDVRDRPQTAHGLVEKENAKQVLSVLPGGVGFKGGMLIPALVSNEVAGGSQRRHKN